MRRAPPSREDDADDRNIPPPGHNWLGRTDPYANPCTLTALLNQLSEWEAEEEEEEWWSSPDCERASLERGGGGGGGRGGGGRGEVGFHRTAQGARPAPCSVYVTPASLTGLRGYRRWNDVLGKRASSPTRSCESLAHSPVGKGSTPMPPLPYICYSPPPPRRRKRGQP